jgi:hypothetical protein
MTHSPATPASRFLVTVLTMSLTAGTTLPAAVVVPVAIAGSRTVSLRGIDAPNQAELDSQPVPNAWSMLTALTPSTEIFVTLRNRTTTKFRFVKVGDSEIRVTNSAGAEIGIPRPDVLEVAISRRTANQIQFAFISLLLGAGELVLYASVPSHKPFFLWLGSGLIVLGGLLFRPRHVAIYKAPPASSGLIVPSEQ